MVMNRNAHTTMNAAMAAAARCISRVTVKLQRAVWGGVADAVHIKFLPRKIWNLPALGWLTSQI
jgi:hypothetical protein